MKRVRILLALGAFFVPVMIVAGCGGVPGDSVATVDGNSIEKSDFSHWMNVAAKTSGQTTVVPDPPDFTACVAAKKKSAPKPAKGQPNTTDAQYKTQCKQEYEGLRNQVVQLLVSYQWIQGEAKDLGVKVTDAEVKKALDQQKKQSFPKAGDYEKFLKTSGQTNDDIVQRVKVDLLSTKIRDKITKGKDQVSPAAISAYYDKNKARFAQPEQRDIRIVLTKAKDKADQAKAALDSGDSWKTVAKKYSVDTQSKAQGGKLPPVSKGQQEKALDDAIFNAKKGKLVGPVKTQFGYYVFEVDKVTPASQQSLQQATPTIKQLLAAQNQQKSLDAFVKKFRDKWKGKTECSDGYKTPDCKNGPKATPTPTAAPQQQAPQQQQPQG
jgi:parvulin-like peptidyl-prolyl isomerase